MIVMIFIFFLLVGIIGLCMIKKRLIVIMKCSGVLEWGFFVIIVMVIGVYCMEWCLKIYIMSGNWLLVMYGRKDGIQVNKKILGWD